MHLHDVDGDFENFAARRLAEVRRGHDHPDSRLIRAWAAGRGISVASRGQLPVEVLDVYRREFGLDQPVAPRDFICGRCGAPVAVLPRTRSTLVVRTDFSDDDAWRAIGTAVLKPVEEGCRTDAELLDDAAFRGLSTLQVLNRIPNDCENKLLVIVDELAVGVPRHPVLVVDLIDERGRSLRVEPAAVESMVDSINTATLRFASFEHWADADGIVVDL